MKKLGLLFACILMMITILGGCSNSDEQSEYEISYVNMDGTTTYKVGYDTDTTDVDELVDEMLGLLSEDPGQIEYKNAIPSSVTLNYYSRSDDELTIDFDEGYLEMDTVTEVLCRAAIVQTMVQIDGVSYVAITVNDAPITDEDGNVYGFMNEEDFIENPGEQINMYQQSTITLYYANEDGDGLVAETDTVYETSDMSMEKVVIEQLMKQPETKGLRSVIPSGTNLLGVSVMDGICVVNFDNGFLNQDYSIAESVVIYSIVNSLTELSSISKVQISVDGETDIIYRTAYSLSELYERNLDCVQELESSPQTEGEGYSSNN
ncbi:GerMN domain-containing protein [Eubacterium oxidoreducens]|uniref:Germination protein M n=1 Tax=Eubacterium oxidoreducens TaxID=1732 RepID=A0A1G6B5V7_EUBOX|nr:GerMN domain-containing protein [Eubacterium oxidoreducens]SDB16027.1 germination protein M [Eubacterium oxidoreducens]